MSGAAPGQPRLEARASTLVAAFFAAYLLLALIYWPALRGTLLWNDADYVTKPALQSVAGLGRIWREPGATEQYYPLLHTAFWFEHRLWGDAALGYHLATLALHALSCILFFALLERLADPESTGGVAYPRRAAWLAAALFALHPVCVESVGWISEQKNTLSLALSLAAVLAYLRFERGRSAGAYGLALALFLCAILSKSLTATLPAVLWVLAWWRRGRLQWRKDLLPLIPWCAIGAVVGLFTAWDERHFGGAEGLHFVLSPADRCIVAGRAVWFYLGKIFWPHPLMFFYEHWTLVSGKWTSYLGLACALLATVLLAGYARRDRGPLCCWLLFVGTLFPVLGFLNIYAFVFSYVADHWQYLSMLPVLAGVAGGWSAFTEKRGGIVLRWVAPIVVLAFLGVLSWRQARLYASEETLYRETLKANPNAWLPHANLGTMELDAGRPELAIEQFRAALALISQPELHVNLGDAYAALHRLPEAMGEYRAAIDLRPDFAVARVRLARLLVLGGRFAEAVPQYSEALKYQPRRADWDLGLGVALAESGRLAESIEAYEAAIAIDPGFAEAYNDEGTSLADLGRVDEAIVKLQEAVRLKADYTDARRNLAALLERSASAIANRGDLARAVPLYREAIEMAPDFVAARCDLALALTLGGQPQEAIAQLHEALRLEPRKAVAHAYLGLALSRSGRLREAIAEYDEALVLSPGDQDVLVQREEARRLLSSSH